MLDAVGSNRALPCLGCKELKSGQRCFRAFVEPELDDRQACAEGAFAGDF